MAETLLQTNRRAAMILVMAAAVPVLLGVGFLVGGLRAGSPIIGGIGTLLVLGGAWAMYRPIKLFVGPRLALDRQHLWVYLRGFAASQVPLDAVECFFIGQAPSPVRVRQAAGRVENVTVVVRLAERSKTWHDRPVDSALGTWRDGYITILGLWCEPLDGDVVNRMNRRLSLAKRQLAGEASPGQGVE